MSWTIKSSDGHDAVPPGALDRARARPEHRAREIARLAGLPRGRWSSVSTACTASAHSLGEALPAVQDGDAKLMLAGGYDALTTWFDVLGFGLLGALTKDHDDEPEQRVAARSTATAPASCSARAR